MNPPKKKKKELRKGITNQNRLYFEAQFSSNRKGGKKKKKVKIYKICVFIQQRIMAYE